MNRYKNLVLVAGGAGITPFLAMVRDLLKRHQLLQDGLPTDVQLVWCVRRRSELATLKTIKPGQIYPGYSATKTGSLNLTIKAYVTGDEAIAGESVEQFTPTIHAAPLPDSPQKGEQPSRNGMQTVNSSQNLWMIALIVASCIGFVLMHALLYNYVSSPKFLKKGEKFPTAEEGVLHFVALFVGIVICGGSVIFFWIASTRSGKGSSSGLEPTQMRDLEGNDESDLLDHTSVTEGKRPQFQGTTSSCTYPQFNSVLHVQCN